MIWDTQDAQALKGKSIAGVPSQGDRLTYLNGVWRTGSLGSQLIVLDDFMRSGGSSGVPAADIGDLSWASSKIGSGTGEAATSSFLDAITGYQNPGTAVLTSPNAAASAVVITFPGAYGLTYLADYTLTAVFKIDQNDTDTEFRIGLCNTAAASPPSHGVFIEKAAADTEWYGVQRNAGSQTRTAAGLLACSTDYVCARMRRLSATSTGFAMATTLAGLETAAEQVVSATYPAGFPPGCQIFACVETATTASKSGSVDLVIYTTAISR